MNIRNKITIRRQLFITFMLLTLLPLLFLGLVISSQSIISQKSLIQNWMDELTAQTAMTISVYLKEQEHKVELLLRSNYIPEKSREEQSTILSKFLSASKDELHGYVFNEIILLDENGRTVVDVSRNEMKRVGRLEDMSGSPDFIIPFKSKTRQYSDVYYHDETGVPLIKINYPLLDLNTSEVKGVIVAELQLTFMRSIISNIKVGEDGISFIVDHEGRIISHPNPSQVFRGKVFSPPGVPSLQRGLSGEYAVVASRPVNFGKNPLYIISEIHAFEAFAYMPGFLAIILATLVAFGIIAMLLSFFLISQIVEPIEQLSKTVRQISGGDFSIRAKIVSNNEIGGLAADFNLMTENLLSILKAYKNEKQLVRRAIDSLCHPFFVVDVKNYQIVLANKAAKFGELNSESKCHKLTHSSDVPCSSSEHPCPIREIIKTKKSMMVEHVHYDENGNPGIYEVHGSPIFDEDGEVIQVIEYVMDVSEKKRIEQNLWRAREAGMADVAAEVMHKIGNAITPAKVSGLNVWRRLEGSPLRTDLGDSFAELNELISSNTTIPQEEKEHFGKITSLLPKMITEELNYFLDEIINICEKHENIEHIINLQDQYDKQRGENVSVNVNDIVEDALQIQEDLLREKAVTVVKELKEIPNIKTDRVKLLEIIILLIKNGIEASMSNSFGNRQLVLATGVYNEDDGKFVYFSVQDNGLGFTESEKGRLFSFAYMTSEDMNRGLELHAVANYVNLIEGGIEAYSEGPGKGATFITRLPIVLKKEEKNDDYALN